MKKIKYLMPILGLTATVATVAPIATACNKKQDDSKSTVKYIPRNLLNIEAGVLKGLKDGANITQYNCLEVPSDVNAVAENAFPLKELGDNAYPTITSLKIHSSLRDLGCRCFSGLTSLKEIDMTEVDQSQMEYINANLMVNLLGKSTQLRYEEYYLPFGDIYESSTRYVQINFNKNLPEDKLSTLKNKFFITRKGNETTIIPIVPTTWLVTATSDNLAVNKKENNFIRGGMGDKKAFNEIELNTTPTSKQHIVYSYSRTGGTKNVDMHVSDMDYSVPCGFMVKDDVSSRAYKTPNLYMYNTESEKEARENDYVDYTLTISCYEIDKDDYDIEDTFDKIPVWVQPVEGFKSSYRWVHTTEVEFDKVNSTALIGAEGSELGAFAVAKSNIVMRGEGSLKPCDESYELSTDKQDIIEIGQDKQTAGAIAEGTAKLTVKALDGGYKPVTKDMDVNVVGYFMKDIAGDGVLKSVTPTTYKKGVDTHSFAGVIWTDSVFQAGTAKFKLSQSNILFDENDVQIMVYSTDAQGHTTVRTLAPTTDYKVDTQTTPETPKIELQGTEAAKLQPGEVVYFWVQGTSTEDALGVVFTSSN